METFFGKGKSQTSLWHTRKFVVLTLARVLSCYLKADVFGLGVMCGQGWRGLTPRCWRAAWGTLVELGTGGHFSQRQFLIKSFQWFVACTQLFIRHYFQDIILNWYSLFIYKIHLSHSFCLIAGSQSGKDLIYPSEKKKRTNIILKCHFQRICPRFKVSVCDF